MLNCIFHNVKIITRAGPYATNESEAGRWLALTESEGRPQRRLGRRPGAVRLVRAHPSNSTEGTNLCRCDRFMSRPIVGFGAAIPMTSAASCILYTGCGLAISSSARRIRRMGEGLGQIANRGRGWFSN